MPQVIRSLSARPYLLFVAALITVTALLLGTNQSFSASSLKVISPNGGQSYAVGQSVNIKWAKGNGGAKVKVTLIKGGKGYLSITKKTANDGKLTWKVPSKVKAGSNYKIKIQSLSDTKVSDTSNKPFKITKAKSTKAKDTKTATFKVTQPKRGKKYKTGKKMAIRWVKGTGTYVKITLLKGKTTTTIHKKTKNDGKHTYTIPATTKAGKTYKVKICSTKSTKSCATSKAFTISKGTTKSTIKVTYPNGAEELEQGSTHVIKYTKNDNAGKFVKIQLTRVKAGKDKGFRYLAKKTKNTGKFSWKIPTTNKYPVDSKYKIKVMAFKGGKTIYDLSDKTFSIVKASSDDSTGDDGTGGGSTGGGNAGGGNAGGGNEGGGREGGGQGNDDDPIVTPDPEEPGGGRDGPGDGPDVESTLTITSPANNEFLFDDNQRIDITFDYTMPAGSKICYYFTPVWHGYGQFQSGTYIQAETNLIGRSGNISITSGQFGQDTGLWKLVFAIESEDVVCAIGMTQYITRVQCAYATTMACDEVELTHDKGAGTGGVNYCYGASEFIGLKEGEVRGSAACQTVVNQWAAECGLTTQTAPGQHVVCSFAGDRFAGRNYLLTSNQFCWWDLLQAYDGDNCAG